MKTALERYNELTILLNEKAGYYRFQELTEFKQWMIADIKTMEIMIYK